MDILFCIGVIGFALLIGVIIGIIMRSFIAVVDRSKRTDDITVEIIEESGPEIYEEASETETVWGAKLKAAEKTPDCDLEGTYVIFCDRDVPAGWACKECRTENEAENACCVVCGAKRG